MKKILLTLGVLFSALAGQAQYLFGFSGTDFIRYNPDSGTTRVVVPNYQTYYDYQGHTTTDHKKRYFRIAQGLLSAPDTIVCINVVTSDVRKDILSADQILRYPQFYQEKLYGLSDQGLVSYDLNTRAFTVEAAAPGLSDATSQTSSAINYTTGIYLFCKTSGGDRTIPDTLLQYNIATHALTRTAIPNLNMYNMEYLAATNTLLFYGSQGSVAQAIFEYNINTAQANLLLASPHIAVISVCAGIDSANSRYFAVAAGIGLNQDTVVTYNKATNTRSLKPIPKSMLNNFKYIRIDTATSPGTGVEETTQEIALSVYPNPVHELLQIDLEGTAMAADKITGVQIISMNGLQCGSYTYSGSGQISISTAHLVPGNYLLTIRTASGRKATKVFVRQ